MLVPVTQALDVMESTNIFLSILKRKTSNLKHVIIRLKKRKHKIIRMKKVL